MSEQPLQVFDATFALYRVDANDEITGAGSALFLGAAAEKASMSGEFTERPVARHGQRYQRVYHEDEVHRIEIENVRTVSAAESAPAAVELRRNERYALVVVWYDYDTEAWAKRTYLGVTAQPVKISDNHIMQTIRLRAESLETDTAGFGEKPSLDIARGGEVRYIGDDTRVLYTYARDGRVFHTVDEDLLDGRATIEFSGGAMLVKFDGVLAMSAAAAGIEVASLDATGATYSDDTPRLEFWMGGVRRASLTAAGALVVANITEGEVPADIIPAMNAAAGNGTGAWLFTLQSGGITCPEILETL